MDSEQAIHHDFAHGELTYLDAILRLQAIGHDSKDAERIVSEWVELLEAGATYKWRPGA